MSKRRSKSVLKIIKVGGARPNFMKIAPLIRAMNKKKGRIEHLLVHTGQHYDENMSDSFFRDLEIPQPDINLGVGSSSHAEQTGRIMIEFEKVLLQHKPDLIVVVGDVNSTVACSLVATKMGIKVAHVEAGLRSFDRTMPEEINRILTDSIADYLFTTEKSGNENLHNEGIPEDKIHFVGNVMIDALVFCLNKIKNTGLPFNGLKEKKYAVVTLHRPSNVDDPDRLKNILDTLYKISKELTLVIPFHPRTRKNIELFGMNDMLVALEQNAVIVEPIGYLEMLRLNKTAKLVITDSGGLQEESTYLGVPCITLRENTERPSTVEIGTNTIVGNDMKLFSESCEAIMSNEFIRGGIPPLWDGRASERIVEIIEHSDTHG